MAENQIVLAAVLFILFWVWTLEEGCSSLLGYLMRSIVVLMYQFWCMNYERPFVTVAEWAANFLVWSHWVSAVSVFLFPDPRFQKKRIYD